MEPSDPDALLQLMAEPIEVEIVEPDVLRRRSYGNAYQHASKRLKAAHKVQYKAICKEIRMFSDLDYSGQVYVLALYHLRRLHQDQFQRYLEEEKQREIRKS